MVKMLSMPLYTAVECPSSFRRMEMAADDKEWMLKKKKKRKASCVNAVEQRASQRMPMLIAPDKDTTGKRAQWMA